MFELLQGYLAEFTYAGIFFVLLLCGLGLPIPEDIPIILSGYFAHLGTINIWAALAVDMTGILIGDLTIYSFGYWMGPRALRHPLLRRFISSNRMQKVEDFFSRHGKKAVFFGRFVAGLRAPLFLAAGITRLPVRTFIIMDASAAAISVPLLLFLSYTFGEKIDLLREWIGTTQRTVTFLTVLVVIWSALRFIYFRRKTNRNGA